MSQLSKVGKPSVGHPERQTKLDWADFVHLVVWLTIQAYQAMRDERIAQKNWEENVFTVRLGEDYIQPIAFESSIRISIRDKVHTSAMKSGEQPTIHAKEIDLSLYDVWEADYLRRRFIWEAKRVGDKRVEKTYGGLNSEYVNEAIYRFIRCEYADGLSDAGVLGYVLDGKVSNIVGDINTTMGRLRSQNPALPPSNHLKLAQPVDNFNDIYQSVHTRTDTTDIQIHHLFLSFDF